MSSTQLSQEEDREQCPEIYAATYAIIAAFQAATIFTIIELLIKFYLNFQKRNGLYFWSLVIAAAGTGIYAFSFTLMFFVSSTPWEFYALINMLGWYAMVTGQSIVLWSRLHLVLRDRIILRSLLAMIIVDAVCLHIPTSILAWGFLSPNHTFWALMYAKVEKVQLTIFVIQETIISGFYVKAALRFLTPSRRDRSRKIFLQLISVNIIVICLNLVLLGVEYSDYWDIQVNLKALVYAVKLKIEFVILNQLMILSNSNLNEMLETNDSVNRSASVRNLSTLTALAESVSPDSAPTNEFKPLPALPNKRTVDGSLSSKEASSDSDNGISSRNRAAQDPNGIVMATKVEQQVSNVESPFSTPSGRTSKDPLPVPSLPHSTPSAGRISSRDEGLGNKEPKLHRIIPAVIRRR